MWRSSTLRALHCQQQVPVFVLSCRLPWALLPPAMTSQFIRRLCRKLFCNFHASSCSMYHWVERLQSHKVKFCFGLFPWRKKNGTSFQGHQCLSLVWLTSLIWQALLPRCYSWQHVFLLSCAWPDLVQAWYSDSNGLERDPQDLWKQLALDDWVGKLLSGCIVGFCSRCTSIP